jgi:putative ABC transport system permease protein
MLLSYLKLSLRLLARNPFFTFINVVGLSVGFAVFFVLWQYSQSELRSDQFHKDHNRIYRLYVDFHHYNGVDWTRYLAGTFPPVFSSIASEQFTEIESVTRIFHQRNFDEVRWRGPQSDTAGWSELETKIVVSHIDKAGERHSFKEENAAYADPNLFQFFSIPLLKGRAENVLKSADAIVLSAFTANKYFGNIDPVGKTLMLNNNQSFTVTGVFQELPKNTHLKFQLVMSTVGIRQFIENIEPYQRSAHNYFKIRPGVSLSQLEERLNTEQRKHWDFTRWGGTESKLSIVLQPLADVSFRVFDFDVFVPKSKYVLWVFKSVSIIVLLMALINYLNLKLASQAKRTKELAMRKTTGARKTDFIVQFLTESIVISTTAVLIALTLVQLMRYPLEVMFQFHIPAWRETPPSFILFFAGMIMLTVILAGLHPAVSVWRMTTRNILGRAKSGENGLGFTQISSVLQFAGALALVIWLFVVYRQINFAINESWGIKRDNVVVLDLPVHENRDVAVEVNSLKNELLQVSGVDDVALSTMVVGDHEEIGVALHRTDTKELFVVAKSDGGVDERFIPFYGLKLLAGRNFIKDNPFDKYAVILTRSSAQSIGYSPGEAIGKDVMVEKYSWRSEIETKAQIIGVMEDHRLDPLVEAGFSNTNRGVILMYGNTLYPKFNLGKLSVRLNDTETEHTIRVMEEKYRLIFPESLFHWYYLNDSMNAHYKAEQTARNQIALFTLIAIGIACLGLLGMISNKVVEKTKEIGIRKVLGAQLLQISRILLSATFRQIVIATSIGIPVAYYLTQQYLLKFAERIELQWWHFALPIVILVLIMLGTVATVVWKAARSNPVDALKYE